MTTTQKTVKLWNQQVPINKVIGTSGMVLFILIWLLLF